MTFLARVTLIPWTIILTYLLPHVSQDGLNEDSEELKIVSLVIGSRHVSKGAKILKSTLVKIPHSVYAPLPGMEQYLPPDLHAN